MSCFSQDVSRFLTPSTWPDTALQNVSGRRRTPSVSQSSRQNGLRCVSSFPSDRVFGVIAVYVGPWALQAGDGGKLILCHLFVRMPNIEGQYCRHGGQCSLGFAAASLFSCGTTSSAPAWEGFRQDGDWWSTLNLPLWRPSAGNSAAVAAEEQREAWPACLATGSLGLSSASTKPPMRNGRVA